ncbi:hypothetical protein CSOJ01_13368 [Colletotrichum sojae]|uniref:Uncharacterized protein n=1 Tax=Colletotrichum sojae TaxID=2175907 RepID=A0A8H6ISZ7_9PEZI|nr:hypothetical protein CSOJ01_13368 [Colletotrichum sojae]
MNEIKPVYYGLALARAEDPRDARVRDFFRRREDAFDNRDEHIAATIRHVETAMAGLGITAHAVPMTQTNDSPDENKLAAGDPRKQVSDALVNIDTSHVESVAMGKQHTPLALRLKHRRSVDSARPVGFRSSARPRTSR